MHSISVPFAFVYQPFLIWSSCQLKVQISFKVLGFSVLKSGQRTMKSCAFAYHLQIPRKYHTFVEATHLAHQLLVLLLEKYNFWKPWVPIRDPYPPHPTSPHPSERGSWQSSLVRLAPFPSIDCVASMELCTPHSYMLTAQPIEGKLVLLTVYSLVWPLPIFIAIIRMICLSADSDMLFCIVNSKAKLLLKKKRYQEQLLDRTDNQLDNLEKMVCVFQ